MTQVQKKVSYTPGPWNSKQIENHDAATDTRYKSWVVEPDIAEFFGKNAEANACAAAAIPELVRELKAVKDMWYVGMSAESFIIAMHDLMPDIEAALAKAGVL